MTGSATVGRWFVLLPAAGLASLVGALIALDVRSWRRTRGLRQGLASGPPDEAAIVHARTSRATLLPGWIGVTLAWTGLAGWIDHAAMSWRVCVALAAGGAVVAVTGFRSRVTSLALSDEGLVVGYAHRRPVVVPWTRCGRLIPPRWPPGGWRLVPGPMLMASDVWGHEILLGDIVARAGLAFEGGRWVRAGSISRER
jgi:hypothetical protein